MNNNTFNLVFNKTVTHLAGFLYGSEVYKEQVEKNIDFNNTIVIIFPKEIVRVASSFTQGFFQKIIEKTGYKDFSNKVKIQSENQEVVKSIYDNLI